MYENIPQELKVLPQWVCWRHELIDGKKTKIPYSPTGRMASVTDPTTWVEFDIAMMAVKGYDGIGFVLSQSDPYCIIDLDNKPDKPCSPEQLERHQKIYEAFDSYTERSVSGTGVHIVVKGKLPTGVHRDNVEAYSDSRYMVFTGDILRGGEIRDYQNLLDVLYGEMQPASRIGLVEEEEVDDDQTIIERASGASNGNKFNALCAGNQEGYESQSEADFALLSIIAFYTRSNAQVRRIFRMTALGKREKAVRNDTYLNFALGRIRANQPSPVDMKQAAANAEAIIAAFKKPESIQAPPIQAPPVSLPQVAHQEVATLPNLDIPLPQGLVGELAVYFYQSAIRPVPEIALAAAIAITAGCVGRSYNISGTGLNQYIILLARTGTGKEGALSGIDNLISATRPQLPMVEQFLGPAHFASGQALIKVLAERPCFVSVLGEFGLTLQQISDQRASAPDKMLKKVLLDLYGKSGWAHMLRSSVYSDTEKNTKMVQSPSVTILGESTPETFFEGLDISHVSEGLIPRFSILEYKGGRPARNRNANCPPPKDLVQKFADLVAVALTTSNNNACCTIKMDEPATRMLDEFDVKADRTMNASHNEVELQLWNRAHLKALKLAGLIAVGNNPHNPIVTSEVARWAIDFVARDVELIAARFRTGNIGIGDSKQVHDLKRAVEIFFQETPAWVLKEPELTKLLALRIVPYKFLSRQLIAVASFRKDKVGATFAIKRTIQNMVDSGNLVEIGKNEKVNGSSFSGVAYTIGTGWS